MIFDMDIMTCSSATSLGCNRLSPNLKKISAIALFGIFLFNTTGYYLLFLAEKMEIKEEIREEINAGYIDEQETTITLARSELSKVEFDDGGEEIIYKDHLYDIVKTAESSTAITYYCINDSAEESLFSALEKHIDVNVAAGRPLKDNNGAKKILDNSVKVYFLANSPFKFEQIMSTVTFPSAPAICLSAKKQKTIQPPRIFC